MTKIKKIFVWILPIYWAFLTYMLLKPGKDVSQFWFLFKGIDKIVHFSIFAFLAFCFLIAFYKVRFVIFIQIMLCYGFLTEILQDIMGWGRTLEFWDLVADTVGCLIGYSVYRVFIKVWLKYQKSV